MRKTRDYPAFKHIDFKWSEGTGLDETGASLDFPKLSAKVRNEIVSFGAPGELRVDDAGVVGGGTRLSPGALHELVAERGDEVVFFDGRNALEAAIGRFRRAVVPDVETTRDFVELLDSGEFDELKGRPVVTYCTGGIRCEVLSSLMTSRGFDFSDHTSVIGTCAGCGGPTNRTVDCTDASCNAEFVLCESCGQCACQVHSQPSAATPVAQRRQQSRSHEGGAANDEPRRRAQGRRGTTRVHIGITTARLIVPDPLRACCRRQRGRPRGRRGLRAYARAERLESASITRMSSARVRDVVWSVIS